MYQDRNNAKAAFTHHTQFLCLSWTDADRKRVLNSLYAFSLVQARLMPERQQKKESGDVDVKKVEVDHLGASLGGLNAKPKRQVKPKSHPASYNHIGESWGITVALPLYKKAETRKSEQKLLNSLRCSTRLSMDIFEIEERERIKKECKNLLSLGYSQGEILKFISNSFLPKRLLKCYMRHSAKRKYQVNVPRFTFYQADLSYYLSGYLRPVQGGFVLKPTSLSVIFWGKPINSDIVHFELSQSIRHK
jgi:hypothetical protein